MYLLIVLALDPHQALEFVFVPLQLALQVDDPHVLGQLLILLLGFGLQGLQLRLNLVHVSLKSEPEVVLMLTEHRDQTLVVVLQRARYLIERLFHFVHILVQLGHKRVLSGPTIRELTSHITHERFKNCVIEAKRYELKF